MKLAVATAVFAALFVVATPTGDTRASQQTARTIPAVAAWDHRHPRPLGSHPDNVPRSIDGIDAAKLAHSKGMRGIVLKNHYDSTAGLAFLARKEAPGLDVFGRIDLNLTVGGMNPVEHMTQAAGGWGRLVWMSTFDGWDPDLSRRDCRPCH
jgi:hypothetical protein